MPRAPPAQPSQRFLHARRSRSFLPPPASSAYRCRLKKLPRYSPIWPNRSKQIPIIFIRLRKAILTTDTVEKIAFARIAIGGKEVRIAALGKGAGMIFPQLVPHATMLVYVLTDAAVEPAILDGYLEQAVEVSFNRISVDGDTSTNDTVLLLASGASGAVVGAENAEFAAALNQVCTSLARQIVADGEGISHVVELHIEGAATDADAFTDSQSDCALAAGQDRLGWQRS
jgi:N-acetylglutamate synthase/N-acetylornithine aminotransferase